MDSNSNPINPTPPPGTDAVNSAPQGIFTPNPDPVPQSPRPASNQSTITGSVVEPASDGLSHQYYSNHPTKTNASGVGDIVIRNGALKKKSELKFKFVIIGVGVFILIVIVALLLVSLRSGDNGRVASIDRALYGYVNYVFYGKEEDARPKTAPAYYDTKLYSIMETNDNVSFLQGADDLFINFRNLYNENFHESGDEMTNLLTNVLDSNHSSLEALARYASLGNIDMPEMIAIYLSDGAEKLRSDVAKTYQDLLNDNDSLLSSLARNHIVMADKIITAYDAYSKNGCIKNAEIDLICIENTQWDNEIMSAVDEFSALSADNEQIYRQLIIGVVNNCWSLVVMFNNVEAI